MRIEKRTCCKCGHQMRAVPERERQLFELASIEYICPNCMHVERVTGIVLKRKE